MPTGRTMQTTSEHESLTDEQLVALAAGGDDLAFASLFERYFDDIFDFAVRMAGDADAAAAAVYGVFADAWDSMRRGRATGNVKIWLFAIARDRAIIESRRAGRATPTGDGAQPDAAGPPQFARPDPDRLATPAVVEDSELAEIVWRSVAALTPRQYALLDVHLRRGLTADQIAKGLDIPQANAYTMLTRLRNGLYESVTYQLLMHRGRRQCAQLDSRLTEMRATELTRRSQQAILNHLRTCARCRDNRRQYPSPLAVFAGFGLVPADPAIKTHVWQNVSAHMQGIGRRRPFSRPAALAHVPAGSNRPFIVAGIISVAAMLAILLAGVIALNSGGGGSTLSDPENVRAIDRDVGDRSTDNVIEVVWDPQNNVQGYSVVWSEEPAELPDTDPDLAGSTTRTESPSLDPGAWYFHLRTQGTDGTWTNTVHLGPFQIVEEDEPSPSPTPSTSATPTKSPTPIVTPNFGTPPPPPTPAPTPDPTPAPDPSAYATTDTATNSRADTGADRGRPHRHPFANALRLRLPSWPARPTLALVQSRQSRLNRPYGIQPLPRHHAVRLDGEGGAGVRGHGRLRRGRRQLPRHSRCLQQLGARQSRRHLRGDHRPLDEGAWQPR